ncbi:hypothetical protein BD779DRAFT_463203 [Infundibulicybe gibba]|nr:hypothetical protein BD779DRAFT_463203 [Infundibulicybe gibba]
MRLLLSEPSPLRSTYSNESGQAIYKVERPAKAVNWTANICRIVPNDVPGAEDMQDRFTPFAQLEWGSLGSFMIRQSGEDMDMSTFMRKEGWGFYGRHRVFMAPDGKEYKWKMGYETSTLVTNDKAEKRVAVFDPKNYVINRRPASLRIFPGGEHITDTIMATFICFEKIRKEAEKNSRWLLGGRHY